MGRIIGLLFVFITFSMGQTKNSCMTCHEGISDIRDENSGMMPAIL